MYGFHLVQLLSNMAIGIFTLRQQLRGLLSKNWTSASSIIAGGFNGTTQYLSTASSSALSFSTSNFTVEGFVYFTTVAGGTSRGVFQISTTAGGIASTLTNTVALGTNNSSGGKWELYAANTSTVASTALPLVNTWYHFAVVRNSSTTTVYINGASVLSVADSTSYTGTYLGIGGYYSTSLLLAGNISNFRVVNGTALYTANFTPPLPPLTNITNTALLTLQSATIVDNSSNNISITNNGTVTTAVNPVLTSTFAGTIKTPYVEYLVVGGGGGGGRASGGGGAGGGVVTGLLPVTIGTSYTVTVGGGGAAGSSYGVAGVAGTTSVIDSVKAVGGGGGGAYNNSASAGGSGGGGSTGGSSGSSVGAQGVFRQGNAGGIGNFGSPSATTLGAGGGGGAGTIGLNVSPGGTYGIGGSGGAGIASTINGTVTVYGGGGGGASGNGTGPGGTGGVGGGGTGGYGASVAAAPGQANTGGGGGGDWNDIGTAGAGGSGIVIVSYPDIYAALTTGGATSPTVSTSGSGSISFTGSTSVYANVTTNTSSFAFAAGDFTVEFWIYTNSSGTYTVYDSRALGTNDLSVMLYLNGNAITFFTNGADRISGGTLTNATWNHIALVKISGSTKLYLNGTQTGSTYTDANTYINSANRPYIGSGSIVVGQNPLNGYMTNVRVVKGVGVYTGTFTPSTIPLQALQAAGTNIAAITGTSTSMLLSAVSGAYLADSSTFANTLAVSTAPTWNQSSPFATGLGYKNRVYTWAPTVASGGTATGTFTV